MFFYGFSVGITIISILLFIFSISYKYISDETRGINAVVAIVAFWLSVISLFGYDYNDKLGQYKALKGEATIKIIITTNESFTDK